VIAVASEHAARGSQGRSPLLRRCHEVAGKRPYTSGNRMLNCVRCCCLLSCRQLLGGTPAREDRRHRQAIVRTENSLCYCPDALDEHRLRNIWASRSYFGWGCGDGSGGGKEAAKTPSPGPPRDGLASGRAPVAEASPNPRGTRSHRSPNTQAPLPLLLSHPFSSPCHQQVQGRLILLA
jgi:hypothetical protein